jgi:NAD(P)-dependent dehydrogenase (short-subunit alcohol dehydrogenase family)
MEGASVLLTGDVQGIGLGIAQRPIADGYNVVIMGIVGPESGFGGASYAADLSNTRQTVLNTISKRHDITGMLNNVGMPARQVEYAEALATYLPVPRATAVKAEQVLAHHL